MQEEDPTTPPTTMCRTGRRERVHWEYYYHPPSTRPNERGGVSTSLSLDLSTSLKFRVRSQRSVEGPGRLSFFQSLIDYSPNSPPGSECRTGGRDPKNWDRRVVFVVPSESTPFFLGFEVGSGSFSRETPPG